MQRTLDYTAVWNDTIALLRAHKEAIIAITGMLIFLPDWASGFFAGKVDLEGATTPAAMIMAMETHWLDNWPILLPTAIVTFFGGLCIYVLLNRSDMARVGDALMLAIKLLPLYFIAQLMAGFFTFIGFMLLIVPGLYVSGRLTPLPAVIASEPELSVKGSIDRAWSMTTGIGWATFFLTLIVALVGIISFFVLQLVIGLIVHLGFGPEGLPFIETAFEALGGAILTAIMITLGTAIYRHLKAQDA